MKKTFLPFVLLFSIVINAQNYTIDVSYVTLDKGEAMPIKSFKTNINPNQNVPQENFIVLVPEVRFQTIEGLGGAFNENGGEALLSLPEAKQNELLKNLFNLDNAGLSFNRTAVGASDFSFDAYSYSMTPEDYDLKYFSIERDKKHLLPLIKKALAQNPDMLLHASPWSPPAWMKYNKSMDKNEIDKTKSRLKNDPKTQKTYADYLVKYVQAYQKEGVTINRLFVQNEPDTYAPFPGCNMSMQQFQDLSLNYIIPEFKKQKLKTSICAGTFRTIDRGDHYKILNKETIGKFDAIGFQYANQSFMSEVTLLDPKIKMMNTETDCFNGDNSTQQAKTRLPEIANYINAGCTNYAYWNIILNETSKSTWGWKQNSMVIIDRKTGDIQYTPDYNAVYIACKNIRPKDKRIAHISSHKIVTVMDENGVIKLLIQNENLENKFIRLFFAEKEINLEIAANAISCIKISSYPIITIK
jgi:glucosylceramidase